MRKPKAIALFCGAGGLSLGFKRAGYNIVLATDINHDALASYAAYFPGATTLECDIRGLDPSSLPGDVDILLGGPPCQGFSSAGQQFWDDPRNKLLAEYVRILDAVRPKWFLMENVEGLLTAWNGQYLCECVKAMLSLGYNVSLEKLYAHAYGIPQRRKRVVIVGNRLGHIFKFPPASYNVSGTIFRKSEATFAQATSDLPPATTDPSVALEYATPPENELQEMLRANTSRLIQHFHLAQGVEQLARIKMLKPGQTMKDLPAEMQHASFRRRANRRVRDGTPSAKRGGAPSGIKRLFADEPALTITGAAMREFVHPTEHRTLSLRECARLQTFPDDFHFCGSTASALQQIANAVPPLLAELIGRQIKDEFGFSVVYTPERPLLEFKLTQSSGMSPALMNTESLLGELVDDQEKQLQLFEETWRHIMCHQPHKSHLGLRELEDGMMCSPRNNAPLRSVPLPPHRRKVMPFQRFYDMYPDLAIAETRSITLLQAEYGLPAGEYAFIEQYCNEAHCDCRRVYVCVMMRGRTMPIAAIGWGWEPREFYANWMKWETDPEAIDQCKGPSLNPLSPQSELAEGALRLCEEVLLKDPAYIERIKEHYRLFREGIDRGRVSHAVNRAARERKQQQKRAAAKKAQKAARKRNRR